VIEAAGRTVLDGFAIVDAQASGDGGGLYVRRASVDVRHCVFDANSADRGGAVYVGAGGRASLTNCTFANNEGRSSGGALFVGHGAEVSVTSSVFAENVASSGGAIEIDNGAVEVGDCVFSANEAGFRGGALAVGPGSQVAIAGSAFDLNKNFSVRGGAISSDSAVVSIDVSGFSENQASAGGALYVIGGTVAVARTWFSDNQATSVGGAVCAEGSAAVSFTNSVFARNSCTDSTGEARGGAAYAGGESLTLMNCTLWANQSQGSGQAGGGAIYLASGALQGTNTIVWGNQPNGVQDTDGPVSTWASFSSLQDGAGPAEHQNKEDDPAFLGGSPFDLRLENDSECVNAGTEEGAPQIDIAGQPRIGRPDIGAFESR
jgi:hypothetical protein